MTFYTYLWIAIFIWIALFQLWLFDDLLFPKRKEQAKKKYNRFEFVWPWKIFTPTEQKFFHLLKQNVDTDKYNIFTKVRLKDVVYLKKASRDKYMPIFNQVSKKHLDFVITDWWGKVILAIELDDKYHNQEKVKKNDKFKDDIFKYMWVPLERFMVGNYYDFKRLDNLL